MTSYSDVRIFLCTTPTNMNYSFDRLMGRGGSAKGVSNRNLGNLRASADLSDRTRLSRRFLRQTKVFCSEVFFTPFHLHRAA